jgi:hypothetical protein
LHRHTAGSRASAKSIHPSARSLRRWASLLSTFGAVAGVQLRTSRSIKPRERDLRDLRLFVLVRFLTRPTNHPRHAACASNFKSKPVRPRCCKGGKYNQRACFLNCQFARVLNPHDARVVRASNHPLSEADLRGTARESASQVRHQQVPGSKVPVRHRLRPASRRSQRRWIIRGLAYVGNQVGIARVIPSLQRLSQRSRHQNARVRGVAIEVTR